MSRVDLPRLSLAALVLARAVHLTVLAGCIAVIGIIGSGFGTLPVLLIILATPVLVQARHLVTAPVDAVSLAVARGETPRAALATVRANLRSLYRVTGRSVARTAVLALLLTLVTGPLAVGAATAAAALGVGGYQSVGLTVLGITFVAVLTGVAAGAPWRFATVAVLDGRDAREAMAWSRSGLAESRGPVARQALVDVAAFGVTLAVLLGPRDVLSPWPRIGLGAVTFVAASAVAVRHRALVFERLDDGSDPEAGVLSRVFAAATGPGARTLVVIFFLGATLTAGVGAVRVTDGYGYEARTYPVSDDPDAATSLSNANRSLGTVNVVALQTERSYNRTAGAWGRPIRFRTAVDHRDNQVRSTFSAREIGRTERFVGGGTVAFSGYEPDPNRFGPVAYRTGDWTVVAVPAFGDEVPDDPAGPHWVPGGSAPWTISAAGDTLVLTLNATGLRETWDAGADPRARVADDSYVRVVIDRSTGYYERVVVHRNVTWYRTADRETVSNRHRTRTVVRYDYGVDVRRPEPIRDPSPLEVLVDALEF